MATSLQRQLSKLAAPSTSILIPDRVRSSIIFAPSEAAKYSRDIFYQIGLDGLKDLNGINHNIFNKYFESILFNEESRELERAVLDQATNTALDNAIEEFLINLSPFMMTKAALNCLEWLVHRFHIERFNIESILRCILPYYDTKSFVLVLKVLRMDHMKENRCWDWLIPSVQSGLPLPKSVLYSNRNAKFIQWMFDSLDKFLLVHQQYVENAHVFLSFCTSTIIGILHNISQDQKLIHPSNKSKSAQTAVKCSRNCIRNLLQSMQDNKNIKTHDDFHSAIYIMLSMLVILYKENPNICGNLKFQSLAVAILHTNPPTLRKQGVLLLNLIASTTDRIVVTNNKIFNQTMNAIATFSLDTDVFYATKVLLCSKINGNYFTLKELWKRISIVQLSPTQRVNILRDIYYAYKINNYNKNRRCASKFLLQCERQYPTEFSMICKDDENIANEFTGVLARKSELATGHQHADPVMSKAALTEMVSKLGRRIMKIRNMKRQAENVVAEEEVANNSSTKKKQKQSKGKITVKTNKKNMVTAIKKDTNKFAREIINRFSDDDNKEVIEVILRQKVNILLKIFTTSKLIDGLIITIKKCISNKCTRLAIKRMCVVANKLSDPNQQNNVIKEQILNTLVPFLFPKNEAQVNIYRTILSSKFAQDHPLLSKFVQPLLKDTETPENICKHSFEILSTEKENLNCSHWISTFMNNTSNASYGLLALISLKQEQDIETVFPVFEKSSLSSHGCYPVSSSNICKVLKIADKRKEISLDMLLTSLSNFELKNESLLHRIFNFALRSSEKNEENKKSCTSFLHNFIELNFVKSSHLLQFWIRMILTNNRQQYQADNSDEVTILTNEHNADDQHKNYYQLRTLQFLEYIFNKLAHTSTVNKKKKGSSEIASSSPEKDRNKVEASKQGKTTASVPSKVTRQSIQLLANKDYQQSPPARCTRSSLRAKLTTDKELGPTITNTPTVLVQPIPEESTVSTKVTVNDNSEPPSVESSQESSSKDSTSKEEYYRSETSGLVEILLTQCVKHESDIIRHWGIKCLKILLQWKYLDDDWATVIDYIIKYKEEIIAEEMQLKIVITKMMGEIKNQGKLLDRIVKIITDESKVDAVRFGFLDLFDDGNSAIFTKLLDPIKCLFKNNPDSKYLIAYLGTFSGNSLEHMEVISEALKHKKTAKRILSKLTGFVFDNCTAEVKKRLFATMITGSGQCHSGELRVAIQRCVRKWVLDAPIVVSELDVCLSIQKRQAAAGGASDSRSNRQSLSGKPAQVDYSIDWVSRTESVLEFAQNRKKLRRRTKLISPLCKLLKICIALEEQTPVEYLKQLILTSLTISCEQEDESDYKSNSDDWVHFNVESIIDCLRCSRNPQTHHHALILLNYAAKRYPEQVLHGVMSLFTLMGNSILRQDDAYSTQLIQQTVTTIIPTLATAGTVPQFSRDRVSAVPKKN